MYNKSYQLVFEKLSIYQKSPLLPEFGLLLRFLRFR